MQTNKNGIAVQTPGRKRKRERKPLTDELGTRRFELIDDEAKVEIVVPYFSPILDLLLKDGWREIK